MNDACEEAEEERERGSGKEREESWEGKSTRQRNVMAQCQSSS